MATIKDSFKDISKDSETLAKDYLKLFSIGQVEKISLFFGVLSSIFIISLLLLFVAIFCSFALANYLNSLLEHNYSGYFIVAGFYLLLTLFLLIKAIKTKTPLLTNLFVKLIGFVLNIDAERSKNLKQLRVEKEQVKNKIDNDKSKIKAEAQLIKYRVMESFFKEFFGLFKSKKNTNSF